MIKSEDVMKNEGLRTQYRKWKDDPMTQMVVDILRAECRINTLPPDYCKGEIALVLVGENFGAQNLLDKMMNLDKSFEQTEEELQADYGAQAIFAKQNGKG